MTLTPTDIPTVEPEIIYSGQTVQWIKSLSDYPATDYTLKYYLSGPASYTLTAAAYNTTDHKISIASVISGAYTYGIYSWEAYAERTVLGVAEKWLIPGGTGFLTIKTSAGKTHAKKMLDAIEAFLEGQSVTDINSYSIGGRSIARMTKEELIKWRTFYRNEYSAEVANENRINGKATGNRILMRFRRPA